MEEIKGNTQTKKVFVIIVVYNGLFLNWIDNCLKSLVNSIYPVNIIVVDNGSTDGSIDFIRKGYPFVNFIVSKANLGFGGGNNLGLEVAVKNNADYVFLLNQDAYIESDTILKLVNAAIQNPYYSIISPLIMKVDGLHFDNKFAIYANESNCPGLLEKISDRVDIDHIFPSGFIMAAAWFIDIKCIKSIGGFSPTFFHYGEDDNYYNRLKFKNGKIGIYSNAIVFHNPFKKKSISKNKYYSSYQRVSLLIHLSNPNINRPFFIRWIMILGRILKNCIGNDFADFKCYINDIVYVTKHYTQIHRNLKLSKDSHANYAFLKVD